MPGVELPLHHLLGVLLVGAALAKLVRRDAWRRSLSGYRLARPAGAVAWAVPAAELLIGAGLVAGRPAAGWAAAVLLSAFSVGLGVELAAGTPPPGCGCLVPSTRPPGPLSLVRNGCLIAAAVAVAAGVRPVLGDAFWIASYVALWAAVAGLGALVLALYRQVGLLHLRLGPRGAFEHDGEGLELGAPAPRALRHALVVFTSASCPICHQIVPGLRAIASDHGVQVVHARDEDAEGRALHEEYAVPGTPYAVYVGLDGSVRAKGAVNTLEQLEGLIATGRRREQQRVVGHVA
jgi:hypothetical protein